jgi:hypothetical protein
VADFHSGNGGLRNENENEMFFHTWPPRSPDFTPCDFFLCGYVKDVVYLPPVSNDLQELRQHIIAAVAAINRDMMGRVDRNGLSN